MNTEGDSNQEELASSGQSPQALPKMPTGVAGLDDILHGGLPQARTTLLIGGPGSGKTVLSLETLYRSAQAGQPGLYISFEETAAAVRTNALSMGWDLAELERQGLLVLIDPKLDYHAVRAGEFSIKGLLAILEGQAERIGSQLVVIDAIDALMRLFEDPGRRDDEVYRLHYWLIERGLTTMVTLKTRPERPAEPSFPFLDFLADCVVMLDQRVVEQVCTRRLRVVKYRGSGYVSNECPFVITPEAVVMMPVSSAELLQKPLGPSKSAGHKKLDELLGGGYRQGSAVFVVGPSGCGKTTVACTLAVEAAKRGERTLYVSFEEGEQGLISAMRSPGLDLAPHIERGMIEILTAMPESLGVEEHLLRLLRAVERFDPTHVVIDAISAARRMGSSHAAFDFLVRLLSMCRERGITCIYLNQTPQGAAVEHISGFGISSLIDTMVILDYIWEGEKIGRSILVLKSRGTRHSRLKHRLVISDDGIDVFRPETVGKREEA